MSRTLQRRLAPALAAIALTLPLAGPPAAADDLTAAQARLAGLQAELAELKAVQLAQSGALSPGQAASYESRLAAFEQELRTLTGMLERLGHQQTQLTQRLDRMEADIEYRLSALEGSPSPAGASGGSTSGGSSTAAAPPPAPPPAAAAAAPAPTAPAPAAPAPSTGPTAGQPQVLGYVSQGEVAAVQQGQAAAPTQPQLSLAPAPETGTVKLPAGTAKQQYDYAFGLLRKSEYAQAEQALRAFIAAHPSDPLAANAKYWLGETFYVRGDYQQAASAFGVAYQDHPGGPKAPDSLLKLGLSLSLLGRGDDACSVFQELQTRYASAPANLLQRAKQEEQRLGC